MSYVSEETVHDLLSYCGVSIILIKDDDQMA